MKSDWIDVNDKLPFDDSEYDNWNLIEEFLVTVELVNKDANDGPEVLILNFLSKERTWVDFQHREYDWGWKVTHWQEKPRPYGYRRQ